jgi:hypothetical protein
MNFLFTNTIKHTFFGQTLDKIFYNTTLLEKSLNTEI